MELDLPDPFCLDVIVRDAEVDRLNHANNASYLQWCERTGWAHAEALGCGFEDWQQLGKAMAVHQARLEYLAPCFADEKLMVAVWLTGNDGRLRASRRFQIVRLEDGKTLFRAQLDYVCIDLANGRPRRMPPEFKTAYAVLPSVSAALASTASSTAG